MNFYAGIFVAILGLLLWFGCYACRAGKKNNNKDDVFDKL